MDLFVSHKKKSNGLILCVCHEGLKSEKRYICGYGASPYPACALSLSFHWQVFHYFKSLAIFSFPFSIFKCLKWCLCLIVHIVQLFTFSGTSQSGSVRSYHFRFETSCFHVAVLCFWVNFLEVNILTRPIRRSWLSPIRASVWTCRMEQRACCVLGSVSGGWRSALNAALIRLIRGALVYKQPLHHRRSLIARCPRRVVPSMSVCSLRQENKGAGKGEGERNLRGAVKVHRSTLPPGVLPRYCFNLATDTYVIGNNNTGESIPRLHSPKSTSFPPSQQEVHWLCKWKTWVNQDRSHEWTEHTPPEPRAVQF